MRLAALILLCAFSLSSQELPDAKSIFAKGAELLKTCHTYEYESEMSIEMEVAGKPIKISFTSSVAGINPDRMRIESKSQMGSFIITCDGQYTWMYMPALKQYSKKAALRGPGSWLEQLRISPEMSSAMDKARTIGAESLEIDGVRHDCWVVEMKTDSLSLPMPPGAKLTGSTATFWIDKARGITLQTRMSGEMQGGPMKEPVSMKQQMALRSMRFDEPVSDSLFKFVPPPDAREVAEIGAPGAKKTDLTGKRAPAFRVQSVDGVTYDLSELKGKAVLLEFWATWCEPCRKDMPALDRIYSELKDRGLVILGLNAGEESDVVEKFLKQNRPTYPIALTTGSPVVAAYEVNAFPTYVLIGADGAIAAEQVGSEGEAALRELVKKASLKSR